MEDHKLDQKKQVHREIMSLSTAIIAASILLSASVLFSANIIAKKLSGIPSAQVAQNNGSTNPNEKVEVKERKSAATEGTGKVVIEEFSDFQCPFCQKFYNDSYKIIKEKYIDTGKVKLVYRHFPLSFHQNAQKAAEASECANVQGKFWGYHDLLFKNSKADGAGLYINDLKNYAAELGLNMTKFNSCLDNSDMTKIVADDLAEGQRVGVGGTPTLFINGVRIEGAQPIATFEKAIEEALK